MNSAVAKGAYKAISDYGLIGNCRTAALVGLDGSIDWCCFPRFDAPSVFAAILDAEQGGRFAITPQGSYQSTQRYLGNTNVLETRFATPNGSCTLVDCMPLYRSSDGSPVELHQIIRWVRCQQGTVSLTFEYTPRPDYARAPALLSTHGGKVTMKRDGQELTLETPVAVQVTSDCALATFTLLQGEEAMFLLSYRDTETMEAADTLSPEQHVHRTLQFWEEKSADLEYSGPWRDHVVRSYLVLHLLTYLPTGAIVAAPTTSLPEEIGGVRNWDYRYTWLRDAAFTVDAFLSLHHQDEALAFFQWLGQACPLYGDNLRIMCRVDTSADLEERVLPHLEGHQRSQPVRIGNGAAQQLQHDIYGEVLSTAHLMNSHGVIITDAQWELLRTLTNQAAAHWQEADSGIWEVRGGPYHFVHSKVMCWVALDRATALAKATGHEGLESAAWESAAEAIREQVLHQGWNSRKQTFVQHYGTDAVDASNLLLPLMGFLPFDDPRVVSTVRRIREELGEGPLLHRYRPEETDDGLTGGEGALTLCSFWLVRVLARMGKREDARQLFEEILGYANHLGLFSEMIDPRTGAALGNFPQGLIHSGLILAAQECGMDQEHDDIGSRGFRIDPKPGICLDQRRERA